MKKALLLLLSLVLCNYLINAQSLLDSIRALSATTVCQGDSVKLIAYGGWPFGIDGDLVITAGDTVWVPADTILDFNSIRIDAGGALDILPGAGWLILGCRGSFILNGSIIGRHGTHGGTYSVNVPAEDGSLTGDSIGWDLVQASGGKGGNGGKSCDILGVYSNYAMGGSQFNGNGGGGGGGGSFESRDGFFGKDTVFDGQNGGNASDTISGAGGNSSVTGLYDSFPDSIPGVMFFGENGINDDRNSGCRALFLDVPGTGGGSGGFRGYQGNLIYIKSKYSIQGTGVIDLSGTNGGSGGKVRNCPHDTCIYFSGWGGGGGGGGGGSGGFVEIDYFGDIPSPVILNSKGLGGSGGVLIPNFGTINCGSEDGQNGENANNGVDGNSLLNSFNLSYNYQWQKNGSNINGATDSVYYATQTGNYACIINSSVLGPVASNSIPVIIQNPLSPVINGPSCGSSAVSLIANPVGLAYQWLINGHDSVSASQDTLVTDEAGIYTVQVTNFCGTFTSTPDTFIIESAIGVAISDNSPICVGNSLHINTGVSGGSGTYSGYSWSAPDFANLGNAADPTRTHVTLAMSGPYTVTVTDSKGCTVTASISFDVDSLTDSLSTIDPGNGTTLGTITAIPDGVPAYSYSWSTGDNTASIQEPVGEYTVTISDGAGCTAVTSGWILESGIVSLNDNGIKIYPNPATDEVYLLFDSANYMETGIYDMIGKLASQLDFSRSPGRIDISGLAKGQYLIVFSNKMTGQVLYARLTKIQ